MAGFALQAIGVRWQCADEFFYLFIYYKFKKEAKNECQPKFTFQPRLTGTGWNGQNNPKLTGIRSKVE